MLANRDSLIILKDSEISNQHLQLVFKDKIIDVKEQQIIQLDKALAKSKLRSKLLNFGWGSASVVLTGFLVYFVIH
jgi:hypothetical protein